MLFQFLELEPVLPQQLNRILVGQIVLNVELEIKVERVRAVLRELSLGVAEADAQLNEFHIVAVQFELLVFLNQRTERLFRRESRDNRVIWKSTREFRIDSNYRVLLCYLNYFVHPFVERVRVDIHDVQLVLFNIHRDRNGAENC